MPKSVIINGTTFTLAEQGEEAPWGADQSELIQALVDVASSINSASDILPTTFTVANNVTSPTPVTGLQFDISTILASKITMSIHRSNNSVDLVEERTIDLTYTPSTNTFDLAERSSGADTGVELTISNAGQILYTSSNLNSTSYVGTIRFSAKSLVQ